MSAEARKVGAPTTDRASETPADNPYTQGMAAFVSGLRYEQIPEEVIDRIKLLILDSLVVRSMAPTWNGVSS